MHGRLVARLPSGHLSSRARQDQINRGRREDRAQEVEGLLSTHIDVLDAR